jgi:hypothetical protein
MMDNICLHEMYVNLRMSDNMLADDHNVVVWIRHVGPKTEFVFLKVGRFISTWILSARCFLGLRIHPFMMIWPLTFSSLMSMISGGAKIRTR